MKVFVVGLEPKQLEKTLIKNEFEIDSKTPEVVFAYGGDGTILFSEKTYPNIPKITIKHSQFCYKCVFRETDLKTIIERIKTKKYKLKEYTKLETKIKGKTLVALNEIQIHNKKPTKAIRFNVYADKKLIFNNVVADGIVISTPYGSEAYYSSVGGLAFTKGIGLALNNSHKKEKQIIVDEKSKIEIEITREEAYIIADNNEKMILVKKGDKIIINPHSKKAKFVILE
ncbi:hypothetical protein GQ473_07490 [archaeon]|nr:hypothetical protein [archaeon]